MPLEKQLLPSAELEPVHDKLVWLYVYNDFQKEAADRAATRIRVRFSVSSWPQLLLVDPWTMKVVGQTGRTVESFLAAVKRVTITRPDRANPDALVADLQAAEELAEKLETAPTKREAIAALTGDDTATRYYAAAWLRTEHPEELRNRAGTLLDVPNDLLRYEVCQAIASAPATPAEPVVGPGVAEKLAKLLRDPAGSRNPNVLRSHAIKALVKCGSGASLPAIRPLAVDGAPNNGTTFAAVDAVGAIGARDRFAKAPAVKILLECFPAATGYDDGGDPERAEWWRKAAGRLAKRVHGHLQTLTGTEVPFPDHYDDDSREELLNAFREAAADLRDERTPGGER